MSTPKFFNTAGPIRMEDHYALPPLGRWDMDEIRLLMDQKKYFVLHAPRQSGKTSGLLALRDLLNSEKQYYALYINIEAAQAVRENVSSAIRGIIETLADRAYEQLKDTFLLKETELFRNSDPSSSFSRALSLFCEHLDRPLVLLIDEVDALVGDSLISLLRQLRSGYDKRPAHFPQSIILCGVRDVRDYRIHSSSQKEIITGGSAFNIKAESLSVGNFKPAEIKFLLLEHTKETGQQFEPEVFDLVWRYTGGQPWLVNALAYETCFRIPEGKNRKNVITAQIMMQAKENLIQRRDTHLDQLTDKLREGRVRNVIHPLLSGKSLSTVLQPDDVQYCIDLGIITQRTNGIVAIANDIYKEIIPRTLNWEIQSGMALPEQVWYLAKDQKSLDMVKLLKSFQDFFRQHIDTWLPHFDYPEAGPQLLLMAYLQRIVNGGGRIDREYGLGRGRVDLFLQFPAFDEQHPGSEQKVVIEMKVRRKGQKASVKLMTEGIKQTAEYMEKMSAPEGHLLIFDRSETLSWTKRIYKKQAKVGKHKITVWGM